MNSLRNIFGGGGLNLPGPLANVADILQKFWRFASNPIGALTGLNVNIPSNVGNNPENVVNYLRSTGQMSDDQFNQFSQWAKPFQNLLSRKS